MNAIIALEDGTIYRGISFGAEGERLGEIVFNTSLTGYQEILTDPSYNEQIITMTYPLIGNYGVNPEDVESKNIQVEGFIVKEACKYPSNYRSNMVLGDYLKENGILGIEGIDTRAITRHIRNTGALKCCIMAGNPDQRTAVQKAQDYPGLVDRDIVKDVTCGEPYVWNDSDKGDPSYRVAALDYGVKWNILRMLKARGCEVRVFPASTPAEEIEKMDPDGVFLSNGPGDPAAVTYAVETIKKLKDNFPVFGICLGHQLLGLAFGGTTYKLKFGHRGANQPVKDIDTGKIEITSQNHGFCVDIDSLKDKGIVVTHINCNDNTVEGIRHESLPVFSVQYHPEASPGPHDASYLFDRFIAHMEEYKRKK